MNDVELQIEILDHLVAWCLCFGRYRSLDHRIFARTVAGIRPVETHHVDMASLGGKIPTYAASNLGVFFD
jgi:hypothetical protein